MILADSDFTVLIKGSFVKGGPGVNRGSSVSLPFSIPAGRRAHWVFLVPLRSIPLVPRRPKSGEPGTGRGKDKKGDKKKGQAADPDKPETPVPPSDPDEKVSQLTFF